MTESLSTTLRNELALPSNDNESHLRCTCGDCFADALAPLREAYADLADAARYLPLVPEQMPGGRVVGEIVIERFGLALHRLHVMVSPDVPMTPRHAERAE